MRRMIRGTSSQTWSARTKSSWMTENRGSGRRNSLVWDRDLVYPHTCLNVCLSGNMFMFYIAGHEVRIV